MKRKEYLSNKTRNDKNIPKEPSIINQKKENLNEITKIKNIKEKKEDKPINLSENEQEISNLKQELHKLKEELKYKVDLERNLKEERKKYETLKKDSENDKQNNKLLEKLKKKDIHIKRLEEENRKQIESKDLEIKSLKQQAEKLNREIKIKEKDIENKNFWELNSQYSEMKKEIQSKNEEILNLKNLSEKEKKELKEIIAKKKKKLTEKKIEFDHLNKSLDFLKKKTENLENNFNQYQDFQSIITSVWEERKKLFEFFEENNN